MIFRSLLVAALVSLSFAAGCGGPSSNKAPDTAANAAGLPDKARVAAFLTAKVKFPASKDQVLESFEDTPDFNDTELKFIKSTLAPGNYASADEVTKALGLQ